MSRRQPPQPNGDRQALLSCALVLAVFVFFWVVFLAPWLIDLLK